MAHISIKSIDFGYRGKSIYESFSLDINPGQSKGWIVGLLGESGIGKSTVLDLILESKKPQAGEISILPRESIVSFQPQEHVLLDHLNVRENIEYLLNLSSYKHKGDKEHLDKIISTLSLRGLMNNNTEISKLSGGEKQRVMLARTMSIKPDILILDEPTKGLDSLRKHALLLELRSIADEFGCLIIMATHSIYDVRGVADEMIYLHRNEGSVKAIQREITNDETDDLFLDIINSSYPYLALIHVNPENIKLINSDGDLNIGDSILLQSSCIKFSNEGVIPASVKFENNYCKHIEVLGSTLILPKDQKSGSSSYFFYDELSFVFKNQGEVLNLNITIG